MRGRVRKILVGGAAFLAGLSIAVVPSLGANQSVNATSNDTFSPKNVTVSLGESVTWKNTGGRHNVKFNDNSFTMPSTASTSSWTVSRTFTTAGTFAYYCEVHQDDGMTGTVVVTPASTTTGPTTTGGGTGGGGGGGGTQTQPPQQVITFQDKTQPRIKVEGANTKRAILLIVRVDETSTVTASGTINVPGASKVLKLKTVERKVDASGPAKLKLTLSSKVRKAVGSALKRGKKLKAKIKIVATDAAGNSRTSKSTVKLKK